MSLLWISPTLLLKAQHDFLLPKYSNQSKPSCSDAATAGPSTTGEEANTLGSQYTYTNLLELSIPGNDIAIGEEATIRADIHRGKVSSDLQL